MAETADSQMLLYDRLCEAIDNNDIKNVRLCMKKRVDLNKSSNLVRNQTLMGPLALACCRGHEEVMEELLKGGAYPNQVSGWPLRPAMFIAAEKRVLTLSMLRCLISHGAHVDFRDDDDSQTILHYLARGQFNDTRNNLLSAAKLVLDNGASFYARDIRFNTPLYFACSCGNIDLVNFFIAEGADVNFEIGHMTMLRRAAVRCDIDAFDLLLNVGANRHLHPNALIKPCSKNNHAMIEKILVTCDVDINQKMRGYHPQITTILLRACWFHYITSETVRLLLDRGADVRAVSDTGDTALHYAAMRCDCNKIRQLLSYNAPLHIKNNKNQTPLSKLSEPFINSYSLSSQVDIQDQRDYVTKYYQAGVLAFKMLVIAGAKVTADDEHKRNKFRIKHPEAQLLDYEIRSTRSLKELCRFVIRESIPVPVDFSLCKLPIPKLLQNYLNFPEFDPLVEEYSKVKDEDDEIYYDYDDDDDEDDDYYDDSELGRRINCCMT